MAEPAHASEPARTTRPTRATGSSTTARPSRRRASGPPGSGPGDAEVRGDFTEIRTALDARLTDLRAEHEQAVVDLRDLQRDRVSDGAGDDQADTGTKTFEREQELALVHGISERMQQVEHALARLDEGTYGYCERCGNPIPTARLEAFPSVTLCVACKQIEERR